MIAGGCPPAPPPPPPPPAPSLQGPPEPPPPSEFLNKVVSPELPQYLKKKPRREVDVPMKKIPWSSATVGYHPKFL